MGHNRVIGSLNSHARHLLALLDNSAVSLDRVAAAIAVGIDRGAPPEFEPLQLIDALADRADGVESVEGAIQYVFGALGFAPNRADYYALSNSLLHRVLETRRGNPISLAIVAIEISKRLGFPLVPVGMPAHFLIGYRSVPGSSPDRWFDPFAGGRELSATDARSIFDAITAGSTSFSEEMLGETPVPLVAGRMIANVKNAAIRSGDIGAYIGASEMALGVPGAGVVEHLALVRALTSSGRHDRAIEVYVWLEENDPLNSEEHLASLFRQRAHRN